MNNRLSLHEKLKTLIGNTNVYFQPPASVNISYPCVIYNIGNGETTFADDRLYKYNHRYELMFIYKKPNIDIIEEVMNALPMCKINRVYVADNLNHYVFSVYY